MCRLSWNVGTSASWNPLGFSRPMQLLLYHCIVLYTQYLQDFCESRLVQRMTSSLTRLIPQWPFNHVTNRKVLNLVYLCVGLRLLCIIRFLSNHTHRYYSVQYTDSYTCFVIGSSAANLKFCLKYVLIDASVGIKDYWLRQEKINDSFLLGHFLFCFFGKNLILILYNNNI